MFDIILKNGQIFDGDGKTPITTDLGIKDNIISKDYFRQKEKLYLSSHWCIYL